MSEYRNTKQNEIVLLVWYGRVVFKLTYLKTDSGY